METDINTAVLTAQLVISLLALIGVIIALPTIISDGMETSKSV